MSQLFTWQQRAEILRAENVDLRRQLAEQTERADKEAATGEVWFRRYNECSDACDSANAQFAAAQAEIVALRAALEPFAARIKWYDKDDEARGMKTSDDWLVLAHICYFRRAGEVLAQPSAAAERWQAIITAARALKATYDEAHRINNSEIPVEQWREQYPAAMMAKQKAQTALFAALDAEMQP